MEPGFETAAHPYNLSVCFYTVSRLLPAALIFDSSGTYPRPGRSLKLQLEFLPGSRLCAPDGVVKQLASLKA